MPELPEVETIARGLDAQVRGQHVQRVAVITPSVVRVGDFSSLVGHTFTYVSRRAKLLLLHLDDSRILVFHLKMTGRVWLAGRDQVLPKHTHLVLTLASQDLLLFEDSRRFGFCGIFTQEQLHHWSFFARLGPEPLECSPETLAERLKGRKARIKSLLLDQTVVAGVGNIYADESLFAAGIHPKSTAGNIPYDQLLTLCASLQKVMIKAIRAGGSTISDYRNAYGHSGLFQDQFLVYGKKGDPCPGCGQILETIKVAGRTSTFCSHCQVLY